jgi:hypothetical protein
MRSWLWGFIVVIVVVIVAVSHDVSIAKPKAPAPSPAPGPRAIEIKLVKKACAGQKARCIGPNSSVGLIKDCLYEEASDGSAALESQPVCAVNCDVAGTTVPDNMQCDPCKLAFADKVTFRSSTALPAAQKQQLDSDMSAVQTLANTEAQRLLAAEATLAAARQALAAAKNPNDVQLNTAVRNAKDVLRGIDDADEVTPADPIDYPARLKRGEAEHKVLDDVLAGMLPMLKACVFDKTPGFKFTYDGTYSGIPNLEDPDCKTTMSRDDFVNPMELTMPTTETVVEDVHGATFFLWKHELGKIIMSPVEDIAAELVHESMHLGQEGCGRPALVTGGAATAAYLLNEIQAYVVSGQTFFYRDVLDDTSRKNLLTDPLEAQIQQYRQLATGKRKCSKGPDADVTKLSDDDRHYVAKWANGHRWFQQRLQDPLSAETRDVSAVFAFLCGAKAYCTEIASDTHTITTPKQACPLVP